MSGSLPWSQAPPPPNATDPGETLSRIEQNTAQLLTWVKVLVIVMAITLVLDALIIV